MCVFYFLHDRFSHWIYGSDNITCTFASDKYIYLGYLLN